MNGLESQKVRQDGRQLSQPKRGVSEVMYWIDAGAESFSIFGQVDGALAGKTARQIEIEIPRITKPCLAFSVILGFWFSNAFLGRCICFCDLIALKPLFCVWNLSNIQHPLKIYPVKKKKLHNNTLQYIFLISTVPTG